MVRVGEQFSEASMVWIPRRYFNAKTPLAAILDWIEHREDREFVGERRMREYPMESEQAEKALHEEIERRKRLHLPLYPKWATRGW